LIVDENDYVITTMYSTQVTHIKLIKPVCCSWCYTML